MTLKSSSAMPPSDGNHPVRSVCVYTGASDRMDEKYKKLAREMGRAIAESGLTLVYGGGDTGLMGIVADSALAAGGKVIGIIPEFIKAREVMHKGLTELHVVNTMHERKMMMAQSVDAFIVMPGGFGTLDEFFEILTWRQLKLHAKPIVLLNAYGYWNNLLKLVRGVAGRRFARIEDLDNFITVKNPGDAIRVLKGYLPE